jgi:hypothetical protein
MTPSTDYYACNAAIALSVDAVLEKMHAYRALISMIQGKGPDMQFFSFGLSSTDAFKSASSQQYSDIISYHLKAK